MWIMYSKWSWRLQLNLMFRALYRPPTVAMSLKYVLHRRGRTWRVTHEWQSAIMDIKFRSARNRGVYFLVSRLCRGVYDMFDQAFRKTFALRGGNKYRYSFVFCFLRFAYYPWKIWKSMTYSKKAGINSWQRLSMPKSERGWLLCNSVRVQRSLRNFMH